MFVLFGEKFGQEPTLHFVSIFKFVFVFVYFFCVFVFVYLYVSLFCLEKSLDNFARTTEFFVFLKMSQSVFFKMYFSKCVFCLEKSLDKGQLCTDH